MVVKALNEFAHGTHSAVLVRDRDRDPCQATRSRSRSRKWYGTCKKIVASPPFFRKYQANGARYVTTCKAISEAIK